MAVLTKYQFIPAVNEVHGSWTRFYPIVLLRKVKQGTGKVTKGLTNGSQDAMNL